MTDVIARRGISARKWAELAGLGKDTVSRAIREDYEHITSTTTLTKLADAIGERAAGAAAAIPSVSSLKEILQVLYQALPGTQAPTTDVLEVLAEALRDTLLQLADEPEGADDPKVVRSLARASARQLRS